eukprot:4200440-Amphidinium_carterae.1
MSRVHVCVCTARHYELVVTVVLRACWCFQQCLALWKIVPLLSEVYEGERAMVKDRLSCQLNSD